MHRKKLIRAVRYRRVSTDEQKLKRNSLVAQTEEIDAWVERNPDVIIVGDYCDEGISGSRIDRTDLQRLLKDVENGDIDIILVTKLDRWFRDLSLYYKTQEVLDKYNVAWKTVLEDYDTSTADGRLKVNIMLSVAQNEIERTSERIKVVFKSKIKNKQAITANQPFGWTIVPGNGAKMVVHHPEEEAMLNDYLDHLELTHSKRGALKFMNDKYGTSVSYKTMDIAVKTTLLYGCYEGIKDYCPPYMTKQRYDEIQKIANRNIKNNTVDDVYIFSGLLKCPLCGCRLSGFRQKQKNKDGSIRIYHRYRCNKHKLSMTCDYVTTLSENVLERKVLAQVMPQLERLIVETKVEEKKAKPKVDKRKIEAEMERLNKMYLKGRIKEEVYDREYNALTESLNKLEVTPPRDFSKIKELLDSDLPTLYQTMSNKEKQIFWRSIIESITFDGKEPLIHFL